MNKIKYILAIAGIIIGLGMPLMPTVVGAQADPFNCQDNPDNAVCKQTMTLPEYIRTISNTLLFILGSVAVITIIIAGIRYTTSHGDPKAVQVAKDTLFYAVIGVVVAILAFAIVNFVIDAFFVKA